MLLILLHLKFKVNEVSEISLESAFPNSFMFLILLILKSKVNEVS